MGDPDLPARTRLGPPGVDVAAFGPQPPARAAAMVRGLADRLEGAEPPPEGEEGSAFSRDPAEAARALRTLRPGAEPLVAFVGKLILSKGIDLLLAAWPLVLERVPDARLVVIGFGAFASGARDLARQLAAGDLEAVRELAERGRGAEGGTPGVLRFLAAFVDDLAGDDGRRVAYLSAATGLGESVAFTGRLEHEELADVLPACRALVVPSTFPEAFGMVAAEAAACGTLPISAEHSGLAEVSRELAASLPEPARGLVSFPLGERAVQELAARIVTWLQVPAEVGDDVRDALVSTARERYSWEGVGRGVMAAAQGRLDELPEPAPAPGAGAPHAWALG
jgi:glycosyltransferase involved in cell wall biosynthesis